MRSTCVHSLPRKAKSLMNFIIYSKQNIISLLPVGIYFKHTQPEKGATVLKIMDFIPGNRVAAYLIRALSLYFALHTALGKWGQCEAFVWSNCANACISLMRYMQFCLTAGE